MFTSARNQAGLSRELAAMRLHIGGRTLNNYEHGHTIVPPEVALRMGDVYNDPSITAKYCAEYCPIGQIFAHSVDSKGLCSAVLGLIKEHGHVERIRESLIDITSDGVIDKSEMAQFEAILNELLDLEEQIERIKLHAARVLPLPQIMQKRKETALAAR